MVLEGVVGTGGMVVLMMVTLLVMMSGADGGDFAGNDGDDGGADDGDFAGNDEWC